MVMLFGVQVVDSPEDLARPCLLRRSSHRSSPKVRRVRPHTVCHWIRPLVQAISCSRMSLAWLPPSALLTQGPCCRRSSCLPR